MRCQTFEGLKTFVQSPSLRRQLSHDTHEFIQPAHLDTNNCLSLPSALAAYRSFYLDLIDENRTGAALFHCTTGKDRTGWAAASFLLLLGASEDDVRADYLETNTDLTPALQPMLAALKAKGVPTELLDPILGVRDSYLDAALDEVRTRYGTIDNYARDGLGLTDPQIDALRRRFTESA